MKGPMSNQETKPKSANAPTRVAKKDSGDLPKGKYQEWREHASHGLVQVDPCPR